MAKGRRFAGGFFVADRTIYYNRPHLSMTGQAVAHVVPIVRRKRTWAWAAVALLCLIAAAIDMWQETRSRKRWEQVDATIQLSESVPFGNGRFRTQIEVTYIVRERLYSVPASLREVARSRTEANDQALRYRPGSTLRVYVDAANPEDMEIDVGRAERFYVWPLVLLGFGLVSLTVFLILVTRDGKYHCARCGNGVAETHAYCFACGKRIPRRKGKLQE